MAAAGGPDLEDRKWDSSWLTVVVVRRGSKLWHLRQNAGQPRVKSYQGEKVLADRKNDGGAKEEDYTGIKLCPLDISPSLRPSHEHCRHV